VHLSLSLLGGFEARFDEIPLSGFKTGKARALLAYLAVEGGRPHRRQALAGLFWPGYLESSARASLRHALATLRRVLGEPQNPIPFLLVEGETIQFNPASDHWLDVKAFRSLVEEEQPGKTAIGRLEQALSLHQGAFLEGFSLKDSPDFDTWSSIVRDDLQRLALVAMYRLAEAYAGRGELERACKVARQQLELEACREQAHQQLMRLLALRGQRAAALAQYEACRRSLAAELGVEPSPLTARLRDQIRSGEIGPPPPAPIPELEAAEPSPPWGAQPQPKHNLPAPVTSFIGREKEIAQVKELLQTHRLVTLTGPGGVGKTRLALQTARQMTGEFEDGVWLAELAPLEDPELVGQAVGEALGYRLAVGPRALTILKYLLEPKRLLLVLDNCEHLVEACARVADALLHACPRLHLLASSREALEIAGEASFLVPPLGLPDPDALPPLERLAQCEAVRLFVERAAAASPGFQLTPADAPAVAQVCARLDGIPLALELAAARVKLLQVEEIAGRLDDRFRLLTGGSRAALPRYQTLRASTDWSYALLSPRERILLQRLSVFAGDWSLEGAESVGCGEGFEPGEVLELLGELVNKSLVLVQVGNGPETRYRMLETIRQYAREKLVETGQAQAVRERHLSYYISLAEELEAVIRGPDQVAIQDRLEVELDNIRAALAWSLESAGDPGGSPEPGLRLASALWWFWHGRGHAVEGLRWLERLLAHGVDEPSAAHPTSYIRHRAKALGAAGWLAALLYENDRAIQFSEESRDLFQSLGPEGKRGYASALMVLGFWTLDSVIAKELVEESLMVAQEVGDQFSMAQGLMGLGNIARTVHEYDKAQSFYEQSLALREEIGDAEGAAWIHRESGVLAHIQGKYEQARRHFSQSQAMYARLNSPFYFDPVLDIGITYLHQGDYERAEKNFNEVFAFGPRWVFWGCSYMGLSYLGLVALLRGENRLAEERWEECLGLCRKQGLEGYLPVSLLNLGDLAWSEGNLDQAARRYEEALVASRESELIESHVSALLGLGRVLLERCSDDLARAQFKEAVGFWQECREPWVYSSTVEAFALLAASRQDWRSAALLLGATDDWCPRSDRPRIPKELEMRQRAVSAVRGALGEEAFSTARAEGAAMSQEGVVQLILSGC
jgi:predicted ATPase/DNA-binding SARP family transcriptional activator